MTRKIKLNESDYGLIKNNLVEWMKRDDSPFKNANFNTSSLSGLLDLCCYVAFYLSVQLNKTVEEIFMNTAEIENTIYSLIKNFNYIPKMRIPAKKKLRIEYETTDFSPDDKFKIYINNVNYTTNLKIIPTLRDKFQAQYYEDVSVTAFLNENNSYFNTEYRTLYDGVTLGLQAIVPAYQADWEYTQETIDISSDQYIDLMEDVTTYWDDRVITDTIRVFVQELGGTWYEYRNLKNGLFDENLRAYNIEFDKDKGIRIKFDIDNLSRELQATDVVRVFYVVTDGEDANEISGTQEFTNSDFNDVRILKINDDGTTTTVFESLNNDSTVDANFSAKLVDDNGDSAFLDNGSGRQSLESIKESATLFYSTQGRAVTESDYNSLLQSKFTEFKDIRAWGGQKEFLDVEQIMNDAITDNTSINFDGTNYTGPTGAWLEVLETTRLNQYNSEILSIESVDFDDITSGKYTRDVGWVYYSMFDEGFQFIEDQTDIDQVSEFLNDYKILTIYNKYFTPNFTLLKPKISIKLNAQYAKEFNISEMKDNIKEFVNSKSAFGASFDIRDLQNYIESFDSVSSIKNFDYNVKFKVKNKTEGLYDKYIYVRAYTPMVGEINDVLMNMTIPPIPPSTTPTTGNVTITTVDDIVRLNGNEVGSINKELGLMRFKNYDGSNAFFTDGTFYIDNVKLIGNIIGSVRENIIGIESTTDIDLTVE